MPNFLHILIVDDDPDDREIFCDAVSIVDNTVHCIEAKNGEEAIKILSEINIIPDYIFLDLNMPRMSGRQCLKKIKESPVLQNIPVIIYTTSKLQNDITETKEFGASYFITKPFEFAQLEESVRFVLSGQAADVLVG